MAYDAKKRKDSWTVGHDGAYENDPTYNNILTKKDSTRSVLPTVDHDPYV